MQRHELIQKFVRGSLITLLAAGGHHIVTLLTQVVLARLLEPALFGAFAFAQMTVLLFSNFCNTHGSRYVIRETEGTTEKLNVIYTVELCVTACLLLFVFFGAPLLMQAMGKPELTTLVQCLSLLLVRSPFSQPRTLLEKNLAFGHVHMPALFGQTVGAVVGIVLALRGFGVWSLVAWRLTALTGELAVLWGIASERPRLMWNTALAREALAYSWPLMGRSLLVFFYWNVDYYIVGRMLGDAELGYYWLGFQMSHYLLMTKSAINAVLFPTFAQLADRAAIRNAFNLLTRLTGIVFFFPTVIVLISGEDIVRYVLGEKWIPATHVLRIFMILTTIRAVTGYWDSVCLRYGKTKVLFVTSVFNALFIPAVGYFAVRRFGIEGMAITVLMSLLMICPVIAAVISGLIQSSYVTLLTRPLGVAVGLGLLYGACELLLRRSFGLIGSVAALFIFAAAYGASFTPEIRRVLQSVKHREGKT